MINHKNGEIMNRLGNNLLCTFTQILNEKKNVFDFKVIQCGVAIKYTAQQI